jgi:energy-coupling factor transporter ATP-binding protein EcfA2
MLDQAERACGVLAYGDLKRVELAIALANQPRLLLMDEPTAGMAPRNAVALMALTARLARARHRRAVHRARHGRGLRHADRIMVLDRGELIAGGTPEEVRANPDVRASISAPARRCTGSAPLMLSVRRPATPSTAAPISCTASLEVRAARSSRCSAATAPASRPR